LGVGFFWGFARVINLWSGKLAKVLREGAAGFGTLSSLFMAAASIGMALGFGFTSWLLRKRIELGWVPVAGLMMAALSLVVACIPMGGTQAFLDLVKLPANGSPKSLSAILFLGLLASLAFVSSVFLAPLNAWMQDRYPAEKRGDLQSAVNLQNCLAGITAVLLVTGFELGAKSAHLPAVGALQYQMLFLALACLIATLFIIRLLPSDFIRIIALAAIRSLYQIQRIHPERVPSTSGALLLPNHVTYADA